MFNENNIKELRKSPLFLSSKISIIVSDWNHEITELYEQNPMYIVVSLRLTWGGRGPIRDHSDMAPTVGHPATTSVGLSGF